MYQFRFLKDSTSQIGSDAFYEVTGPVEYWSKKSHGQVKQAEILEFSIVSVNFFTYGAGGRTLSFRDLSVGERSARLVGGMRSPAFRRDADKS